MKPVVIEHFTHVTKLRGAVVSVTKEMCFRGGIAVYAGGQKIADATSFSMELPVERKIHERLAERD